VIALAADDELFELLVLKGGNALALAHGIGLRGSLDLDYSLAEETESDDGLGNSLMQALSDHLVREFKVIETKLWAEVGDDLVQARRRAWGITAGGGASRKFRLELSRGEYCDGAGEQHIGDGFAVRVYTPAMIAVEKLRSICQQMTEYQHSAKRKARARDFYDIHAVASEADVDLASGAHTELMRAVFAAKDVPLRLLGRIEGELGFHEGEWDDVRNSIPPGRPMEFQFYADFVVRIVERLEPIWMEDAP
jgi:hypothetical protein